MAAWAKEEDAVILAKARTHSATQIAALLPGRSRASVIGRAWRLGASLGKDEATRRELEHPGRRRPRPAIPPRLAAAPAEAWPSASPAARKAALAVTPRLVLLEALSERQCRWPYGEADLRFCGHAAGEGSPYCRAHHGLAYVPDPTTFDVEALAAAVDRRDARIRPAASAA